jgi:hypothetical protein
MAFKPGSIRIDCKTMDHAHGMWAGMRPQWYTATHIETGVFVGWNDYSESSQYKARETALACLELMIEGVKAYPLPLTPPTGADT